MSYNKTVNDFQFRWIQDLIDPWNMVFTSSKVINCIIVYGISCELCCSIMSRISLKSFCWATVKGEWPFLLHLWGSAWCSKSILAILVYPFLHAKYNDVYSLLSHKSISTFGLLVTPQQHQCDFLNVQFVMVNNHHLCFYYCPLRVLRGFWLSCSVLSGKQ